MLIVRSPVRISFGGGGSDLPVYFEKFGGAVLSTSINKYFYTTLQKRDDGRVQVISSDLRTMETWRDISRMELKRSELAIPLAVIQDLDHDVSLDLFLASEIVAGTGLGSSASVCVGVLKALATYLDMPMSRYELAERAFHIARDLLRKPVGKQDEYAAAFGGLNFITFNPDGSSYVEPLMLPPDCARELENSLMLFFTGAAHNSWRLLEEQEQSARTESALEHLHDIKEFAGQMRRTLMRADLRQFGELLHHGWEAKKKVSASISNSLIDEAYFLARQNGALGGKITGAGGGGFLLLFCEPKYQDGVRDALTKLDLREMAFALDSQGVEVVVNDPFLDQDDKGGRCWTFSPVSAL